jgi:hypothetical protein
MRLRRQRPLMRIVRAARVVLLLAALSGGFLAARAALPTQALPPPSLAVVADTLHPVRLIYGSQSFVILNASTTTISLEGITFARANAPADRAATFAASAFGERHAALPAGQCLRLQTRDLPPDHTPLICGPQTQPVVFEGGVARFWVKRTAQDTGTAFEVRWRNQVLQTCLYSLNTCEFSLP